MAVSRAKREGLNNFFMLALQIVTGDTKVVEQGKGATGCLSIPRGLAWCRMAVVGE
jgi:hypothetical protein